MTNFIDMKYSMLLIDIVTVYLEWLKKNPWRHVVSWENLVLRALLPPYWLSVL